MPLSLNLDLELLPVPDATRDAVARLVDQYRLHRAQYQQAAYKEAHIRGEFIDPFFEALGWDVRNHQGNAPDRREVVVEDTVEVEGGKRAPDYCFRHGREPVFYVEAKAPSVNIREAASPAYQVRRYGWSAGLPLCLLTDFEELAVYDCRRKPLPTDKPAVARVGYLTFEEYLDELPFLYSVFSQEAIPKGFFDRFAESTRGKRGTQTVDTEFLKEIEDWRDQFARNLALRNPTLSVHDLNFAVQALVDRLLFLRIAEDRKLEPYEQLREAAKLTDVYAALLGLFHRADDKYNSGLFDFTRDTLSPRLVVDAKVLKAIIGRLYYPDCPYEFSVIGADILGAVYEQFLGKVIRLTAGHQAKVEEKPEVKKAGGVYYTPTYIVDYIVRHTVGEALASSVGGLSRARPDGGSASGEASHGSAVPGPLRILDPACGSGSFLLGAYDYLLTWHLEHYLATDPARLARGKNPVLVADAQGGYRLATAERKRLLLDHIFGVDIDPQAVEVAKLNLLLKCLEGETETSLQDTLSMFRERALPNLDGNIKCGNSLIGPDYFTARLGYDDDEYRRVNPFDWQAQFPEIMRDGGFDCVIGNPPYVLLQDQFRDQPVIDYYKGHFQVASYKLDTYHLFIEKAVSLTRLGGRASLITPSNFLTNNYLEPLRAFMLRESTIETLWNITGGVFNGVSVDNAVFVVRRGTPQADATIRFVECESGAAPAAVSAEGVPVSQSALAQTEGHLMLPRRSDAAPLWASSVHTVSLDSLATVNFGMQLRDRREFTEDVITVDRAEQLPPGYAKCLTGRDVSRYAVIWSGLACTEDRAAKRGGCWDLAKHHASGKLLTRQIGMHPEFGLDGDGLNCLNTMFMVTVGETIHGHSALYLLGLLNSRLMRAYWLANYYDRRRTFPKIKGTYLERLPIRPIDFSDPADVARHDRMVALVQGMLDLNRRLPAAQTPRDRELLERQIADTDRAIDALVYELYDLTAEEIALVEGEG